MYRKSLGNKCCRANSSRTHCTDVGSSTLSYMERCSAHHCIHRRKSMLLFFGHQSPLVVTFQTSNCWQKYLLKIRKLKNMNQFIFSPCLNNVMFLHSIVQCKKWKLHYFFRSSIRDNFSCYMSKHCQIIIFGSSIT